MLITPGIALLTRRCSRRPIAAGKHVFCEKPHGIDVPGLKIDDGRRRGGATKDLSVVSGLCWRYDPGVRETMKRVHDGAIGEIVAIQENYVSRPYIVRERRPGQSEMEYQLWNWYHFNWLSGDQTAQQLVHSLDKASWALGDRPPLRAWGMGGRQTCIEPRFGDQFDHQAVVFEYDNGVRVFGFTRDQEDCYTDTSDVIIGTKGRCDVLKHTIDGRRRAGSTRARRPTCTTSSTQELFDSIRARQADQQRQLHVPQLECPGHHGPDRLLHRRHGHLGRADALASGRSPCPDTAGTSSRPSSPAPTAATPRPCKGAAERKRWLM